MIWKLDTNVVASLDDNAEGSKSDSESELDSKNSTGSPESENGNEEDVQETVTHTVTFKVIGCKREQIYIRMFWRSAMMQYRMGRTFLLG